MTVAGAKKAFDAGASAIIVSNHGGRVLDQTPATAEVLERIVEWNQGRMKIFVDGGIRQGTDIFKAAGDGSRCCPDCKTICTGGVRWSRRRSKALY